MTTCDLNQVGEFSVTIGETTQTFDLVEFMMGLEEVRGSGELDPSRIIDHIRQWIAQHTGEEVTSIQAEAFLQFAQHAWVEWKKKQQRSLELHFGTK